ncbi:winged helix-turn-helix domain-containing protein [Serratia sp. D1N4]
MENNLYGFLIDNDIQLDIANRRLVRIYTEKTEKTMLFCAVMLNDITMELLVCLLNQHGKNKILSKEELLENIWERNNISSSSQRLWQAIKELRAKLNVVGLPDDFIVNVKGVGYSSNGHVVTPLFY